MGTLAFLADGGEMGALIRAYDWAASPLGPPERWPQGLKTSLRTALTTRHPIFIFWGPWHICFYNDGYRASLGPEKHPAILGAPGREAFDELWDIIGPQIDLVMRGEGATWHENHLVPIYRHGRLAEVYWTYSYGPIDDHTAPNGVGGVLVICTETTEQVRTAAALQQLNERLEERVAEALAERNLMADIVEGTDAFMQAATLDYRWLAINPAAVAEFERIFGVTPRVGDSMLDVLDHLPEHREAVRAAWRRALEGEAYTDIQAFGDPGRARRFYEMRFRPLLDPAGQRIGAYQIVYDVTERLQEQQRLAETEDQLRQAQKIETLGQLTGGVAHDFNNLLTPVMAALDFARLELRDDTEARELVWVGLKAADRARVLVQRLLAFSRRQHLQPRDVDVGHLVESIADMALRSLKPGIELGLDVVPGPLLAHVDPDQLALAVLNLAVNARDAIVGAGRVTIRAAPVDVAAGDTVAAGRYVRIDVIDDGHGMDEATLQRAVEPFFTTKEPGRGTGLGLSSVQGLAIQSGGGFQLHSAPGAGTTATLWLPVSVDAAQAQSVSALPRDSVRGRAASGDRRVLLVDDDALVRAGAAASLRLAGFDVVEAAGGTEALRILKDTPDVHALVTDYAMPGLSGAELARRVRERQPQLPVLLVTGYADLEDQDAAALPRLDKPFRPEELVAALEALPGFRDPG
jgi:PAS domain S-box-containing protein